MFARVAGSRPEQNWWQAPKRLWEDGYLYHLLHSTDLDRPIKASNLDDGLLGRGKSLGDSGYSVCIQNNWKEWRFVKRKDGKMEIS